MSQDKKTFPTWIVVILAILLAGAALFFGGKYYYQEQLKPVSTDSTAKDIAFTIKGGQGPIAIGENLEAAGLIRNATAFRVYLKLHSELESEIKAGVFSLNPSMAPAEILAVITQPPKELSITLLPGWRREEFASYLAEQGLENFDEQEFLDLTEDLEGQLWADTYRVFPTATTEEIVDLLTRTFAQKVTTPLANEIATSSKSLNEILTIASILQRESKTKAEMQQIAGVIENRLAISMPLQFCATAQYASGYNTAQKSWWVEPTLLDTQVQSPYNTYVVSGLPPAPIAAPGIGAIEAALNPAENDYLFYLHDDSGQIHYGKTAADHERNIEQFLR